MVPGSGFYVGDDTELRLYDVETGTRQILAQGTMQIESQAFSPDGQWVGYFWNGGRLGDHISVINMATQEETGVAATDEPLGELDAWWEWSPDSSMIAYTVPANKTEPTTLHVVAIETGQDRAITGQLGSAFWWSPDSRWILYRGPDGLAVTNLDDGTVREVTGYEGFVGWRP